MMRIVCSHGAVSPCQIATQATASTQRGGYNYFGCSRSR
jgi:hypothetical protein